MGTEYANMLLDPYPHTRKLAGLLRVELFSFLSKTLIDSFKLDKKELVITDGNQVLCVPPQQKVQFLAPCSQEEADSRMMLQVAHAVQHGHNNYNMNC